MTLQNMKMFGLGAKRMLRKLFSDEKGEVNIVAIVVLIGIAVLLAVIFRDQVELLLNKLFKTITESAENVVSGE